MDTIREGPQWLMREEVARVAEEALHCEGCDLHAYVIMPNHVHALVTPKNSSSEVDAIDQRSKR